MPERLNTNPHVEDLSLARNKNFPNSVLPVLIYREALMFPADSKKAVIIVQKIFSRNGWSNSWSNGIYFFHHYHSNTHECMAVCSGKAHIIIGGPGGKRLLLSQGDVIILPAGVGHKCSSTSDDFLCVGAYPQGKDYDTNLGRRRELENALANIHKLSNPSNDPIFGKLGFLKTFWTSK